MEVNRLMLVIPGEMVILYVSASLLYRPVLRPRDYKVFILGFIYADGIKTMLLTSDFPHVTPEGQNIFCVFNENKSKSFKMVHLIWNQM